MEKTAPGGAAGWSFGVLWKHALPFLAWPAFGFLVACTCWFFLWRILQNERIQFETRSYEIAEKVTQAQAAQVASNLTMIDQILLLVRIHWLALDGKLEIGQLEDMVTSDGNVLSIAVFNREGRMLFTNTPESWPRGELENIAQMPFFRVQEEAVLDNMFIGMPRTAQGQEGFAVRFSRKIVDREGKFLGIVAVLLDDDSLVAKYDPKALGQRGFVATVGKDGIPRAFQLDGSKQHLARVPAALAPVLAASSGNLYLSAGQLGDAASRYVSWATVDGFPLITVAAVDQTDAVAVLTERQAVAVRIATGASLILLLFVAIATHMSVRFSRQRHKLHVSQAAYRQATEASTEAFVICHPIFDVHGQPNDYKVFDCNGQAAAILGLPSEVVIGSSLLGLERRRGFPSAKETLDNALANGMATHTYAVPNEASEDAKYYNVTATRSDGVVAITVKDVSLEKAHVAHLERKSQEDSLTGLPNRAWVRERLPDMLSRADSSSSKLVVLFVDLDGFKLVNDSLGHAAGDEVLQIVAKRLRVVVRPRDYVIRLGGDEFVIVLENVKEASEAEHVAGRVLHAFQTPLHTSLGIAAVGTSIGISVYPTDAQDAETLYRHADLAMYKAKTSGKNRYQFFDPHYYAAVQARTLREKELRTAIAENQFVLHYQARVNCASREIVGMEALVRWNHPADGLIGPDHFIPLAEETGLILHLGELVIDSVCRQLLAWQNTNYGCTPISINVSSRQFNERDIRESIAAALSKYNVQGKCIEVELTESSMVLDPGRTARTLESIHALGVKLLVDDFGTGYSSLSMLHQMSFDILKIDKSFTKRLGKEGDGEIFVSAIISMAHSLGMRVVAEGVESPEQVEILERLGCDELQGYHLAKPVPADKLPTSLTLR